MFARANISFESARSLPPLVSDYLQRKKELKPFYTHFPDKEGFSALIAENHYREYDRTVLQAVMLDQAQTVANTSRQTLRNIELLAGKTTFTVATGHQLCLFTGPLYFIYKIFSVIHLCETLRQWFPQYQFVPVYWMAGEDHDFAEVNHFSLFGKKIEWEKESGGPVGELGTEGLGKALAQLKEILGNSPHAGELLRLFETAYLKHSTLNSATRFLVNELFGIYGLVTADGNNAQLKVLGKDLFLRDAFEQGAFEKVNQTVAALEKLGYKAQVNPRRVNLFFMTERVRARIVSEDDAYKVSGEDLSFSREELQRLIETEPWKISPNVVLRPLYQQRILPNLVYVGGPGELSYWLEYKSMFDAFSVPFPVLCPRSFFTVIDRSLSARLNKAGLAPADVFRPESELIKEAMEKSNHYLDLEEEKAALGDIYEGLKEKIAAADASLSSAVMAELQKSINGLDNLEKKANRAFKMRSENELNTLHQILQKAFPGGSAQERVENFSAFYGSAGSAFLEAIRTHSDPLELHHKLLIES